MSVDYCLSSLSPLSVPDLSPNLNGAPEATKIKQVSKAMEAIFVNQLTTELGKGIDDTDDSKESSAPYGDFIKQALTEGVTKGGGFGLAKVIENYLTHRNATPTTPAHAFNPTIVHANRAE